MGSRVEILNEGGFRSDGRKQYELRDITIDLRPEGDQADGWATISHGLTQVNVTILGPREAKMRSQTIHNRANINVEVIFAPFSATDRRKRSRGDKRVQEFANTIKSTFEPVIQTHLYARSQIDVCIHILHQDGGVLSAAINATTLALINAGIALNDYVCSVACGVHETKPLLDLNLVEENDVPYLTVAVMPRSGKVTLVNLETKLHMDRFEEIFRLGCDAGKVVHKEMRKAIRGQIGGLVKAMHSINGPEGGARRDDGKENDMAVD